MEGDHDNALTVGVKEAAELLRTSSKQVYLACLAGRLRCRCVGGRVRIPIEEIERLGEERISNYVMSSTDPKLLPFDQGDLLEGVDDVIIWDNSDDKPPSAAPDGDKWPEHVAEALGFSISRSFPIYWDGSGCHILSRMADQYAKVDPKHVARCFQYLALLDVSYDEGIMVGIRDEAALLQFYRLVQPMFAVQMDERFRTDKQRGWWDRGREPEPSGS